MPRRKEEAPIHSLGPDDFRSWQHPIVAKAIETFEVFALEPGDGKLAASIILAADRLAANLKATAHANAQLQAMLRIRDRAFDWLESEINTAAYDSDPSRSTNQIDKALNCALLLLCSQLTQTKLSRPSMEKARTYIRFMSVQGWPRDELLPFIVSWLEQPRDVIDNAAQYLFDQVERWRSQADIQGISFALLKFYDQIDTVKRDELIATLRARVTDKPLDICAKAWALLAMSRIEEAIRSGVDKLAESLLEDLSRERLIDNEITPTVRLINQFPFSAPKDIDERVQVLKQRGFSAAQRIKEVNEQGVLIDLFATSDDTWSFALHATHVAFASYVLITAGYYEIVGAPSHYRVHMEEAIGQKVQLQAQKAKVIPSTYVKWYNAFAVVITLQLGGVIGALIAEVSGSNWQSGALIGVAFAAIVCIANLLTQDFVIVGMAAWLRQRIEDFLGALGKR